MCLYGGARLLAPLIRKIRPGYFERDFRLIRYLGEAPGHRDAMNELATGGNFTLTAANAIDPRAPQRFYILQVHGHSPPNRRRPAQECHRSAPVPGRSNVGNTARW